MTKPNIDLTYFYVVLALGVLLVVMSLLPVSIDRPEPWLKEWTNWLATYVGIGVTARALWIISDAIALRIAGNGD